MRDSTTDRNDATIVRTIVEMGPRLPSMAGGRRGRETLDQFRGTCAPPACDFAQASCSANPRNAGCAGELLSAAGGYGAVPLGAILPPP
ncbi:MAG: hypothetical protein IPG49_07765 [Proteobacteria bacterium]|nr:hypothetical protein [Pseudomonadota bacterium]